jgi:hypothetical protein
MKRLKSSVKTEQDERGVALILRFFVRHVEKLIAGVVILTAAGLALQTLNYRPLSWEAKELEALADSAENAIREGGQNLHIDMEIFNYAKYAEQIKEWIPTEPYRSGGELRPVLYPDRRPRGGFEVLTAESLWGEPVRRADGTVPEQWQHPPLPEFTPGENNTTIWVNLYGTIPWDKQWEICNQTFDSAPEINKPRYIFCEWERAEVHLDKSLIWQPVIVYPGYSEEEPQLDRLIPLEKQQGSFQEGELLLFSDFDVSPAKTYAYRVRLYLGNPNFNLQTTSVKEGVDTTSPFVLSDWSHVARVYVPGRTSVQIKSIILANTADFPQQRAPLLPTRGVMTLDYFDIELGQSLPTVELTNVQRGTLCNISKRQANAFINRDKTPEETVNLNYPDEGLRSDVCVLDFSGGRRLQKRSSRETPELFVPSKALLLMPDGTMQVTTTEPDVFR